ncbi:MAG: 1-phosphofructokinase family hexose kinase [Acidimicrobiales bacterium]
METLVTVTLNPALDVSTTVDAVVAEHKLRCAPPGYEPGGGGINVGRVARRLGVDVGAVVVAGGPTGERLLALAATEGLRTVAVATVGDTRQSFTVSETTTGRQYRFVLPGPALAPGTVDEVVAAIVNLAPGRCVVISGSVPPGTPAGVVASLVEALPGVDVIVDTSGPELVRALTSPAALVKPSARELASVVDRELRTERDIIDAADEVFASARVRALMVSIGPGGAYLVSRDHPPTRLRPPSVKVVSAVGAGDSLVGGLATALCRGDDLISAAVLGVAAGTAAVMTPGSQLCTATGVAELVDQVRVE